MKRFIYSTILLMLVLIACKDNDPVNPIVQPEEDQWPAFADTGAGIVAYKVDGEIRVNKNTSIKDSSMPTLSCIYLYQSVFKQMSFEARRISDDSFYSVIISLDNLIDTGYYKLGSDNNGNRGMYIEGMSMGNSIDYWTNDIDTGYVYITRVDTFTKVITGKFCFKARALFFPDKEKTITNGQFDLKYFN